MVQEFQLSKVQLRTFAREILVEDIKNFICAHPAEFEEFKEKRHNKIKMKGGKGNAQTRQL